MAKINTTNYQPITAWNGTQDLLIVEQPDGTKVATPEQVKQYVEAGDFEATGEIKDGHGNILDDLADLIVTKINKTNIQLGTSFFPPAEIGIQSVTVTFPIAFAHVPKVIVSWDDTPALQTYFKYPLKTVTVTTTGFTVRAERLISPERWYFKYIAVDNNQKRKGMIK